MDHSKVSPQRDACAWPPSCCLEQAARPAAAARLPTNCRLFIDHTAQELESAASVCGDPVRRQFRASIRDPRRPTFLSHKKPRMVQKRALYLPPLLKLAKNGFSFLYIGYCCRKVGPDLSTGTRPSLVRPAGRVTGTPSMAARHAWHGGAPGPAFPPAGVDNVPRSSRGYGLCSSQMH